MPPAAPIAAQMDAITTVLDMSFTCMEVLLLVSSSCGRDPRAEA